MYCKEVKVEHGMLPDDQWLFVLETVWSEKYQSAVMGVFV